MSKYEKLRLSPGVVEELIPRLKAKVVFIPLQSQKQGVLFPLPL
jgi:hypothetical protein